MIVCVAPSPAWDVTYGVERFREHATNRAHTVSARAGGKAVNVARVLHALGEDVTVVAPVGGPTGELFAADLAACGIPLVAVDTRGRPASYGHDRQRRDRRRHDRQRGLHVDRVAGVPRPCRGGDGRGLRRGRGRVAARRVRRSTRTASSLARPLAAECRSWSTRAALPSRQHCAARPSLIKPNLAELPDITDVADPREAARRLSLDSGVAVAVTLGAEGIVLAVGGEVWHGSVARVLHGNPTGAGDAALAAFARGIGSGTPWPEVLHDAVALSGAAVLAPYAGEFDPAHHQELSEQVVVERVGARA